MKIEKSRYQGYVWYSDQTKPEVLNNEEFGEEFRDNENPFIVEAQLFDTVNKKSYSIKYVDGKYICKEYNLADFKGVEKEELSFVAHRIEGVTKLYFNQYWREEADQKCNGMMVLQPKELVFVGFQKYKED